MTPADRLASFYATVASGFTYGTDYMVIDSQMQLSDTAIKRIGNKYVHLTYEYPGPSKVHLSTSTSVRGQWPNVGTIGQIDMDLRMTTLTKAIRLILSKR